MTSPAICWRAAACTISRRSRRLRPGVTPEQARADLAALADDQARRFPESNGGRGVAIQPLHEKIVGDVRGALLMLLAAVGLVLLIACANVASLLLARASGRQREIAIRAALGAGRVRLIRQLITESLLLGAFGGAAGLLAGGWAIALLLAVMPDGIPRVAQIGLDGRLAALAILVSFVSASDLRARARAAGVARPMRRSSCAKPIAPRPAAGTARARGPCSSSARSP